MFRNQKRGILVINSSVICLSRTSLAGTEGMPACPRRLFHMVSWPSFEVDHLGLRKKNGVYRGVARDVRHELAVQHRRETSLTDWMKCLLSLCRSPAHKRSGDNVVQWE